MDRINTALPAIALQQTASVLAAPPSVPSANSSAPSSSAANDTEDTLRLSTGQEIMLSRLFHTNDPDAAGFYTPGAGPSAGSIYKFLSPSDRDMLASVYEYARNQGVDPVQVDHLAFDLAFYRKEPSSVWVQTVTPRFDLDGNLINNDFPPDQEAAAQRILTSKAMSDTAIPQDFLRDLLDPGLTPTHAVDFGFLEQAVYATSKSGFDGATDPGAVLAPRPPERRAAWQAAGLIPSPEEVRAKLAEASGESGDPRERFAHYLIRIPGAASFLSDDDKTLLGSLYATTADKYGPDSPQMREVDKLARTLATLRAAGYLDAADQAAKWATATAADNRHTHGKH